MRWPFLTPVALACRSSSSFVSFEMGAEICVARAIFFFPFKEKSNARLRRGQVGLVTEQKQRFRENRLTREQRRLEQAELLLGPRMVAIASVEEGVERPGIEENYLIHRP